MTEIGRVLLTGLALALSGVGGTATAAEEGSLAYRCDEVVVVGRARVVKEEALPQGEALLGRSRFMLEIAIARVLRGLETRPTVLATVEAHGRMREGADFWMVLAPGADGIYRLRSANLTSLPYTVAAACREGG
jgi:hypothetical protein